MDAPTIDISQSLCDAVIGQQIPVWLQGILSDIAGDAFSRCPIGTPDPLGRPRKFSKALRYTINTKLEGSGASTVGYVQANSPYAFFVHEGTEPHPIRPLGTGYPLRFYWNKTGKVAYPRQVNHPGTQAQPFLKDALVTVIGASLGFATAA